VSGFASVEDAVAAVAAGGMIVVVDDADRENEGDLIMTAEAATPETVGFFVRHTSGVICAPMLGERLDELDLPLMVAANTAPYRTAFTVSVDARAGTTTGISAADRATTIQALIDPATRPADLVRPGHIFPLRYREGGVLKRAGHTEAAVDLARLAGLSPAGVLCEIVSQKDEGDMARRDELEVFAADHDLAIITIADLIAYRRRVETQVERVAEARIPTAHGVFTAVGYDSLLDGIEHVALCTATSATARTCWCACTPSASPVTCSPRCAATAALSSTRHWKPLRHKDVASCCTCAATRAAASA